MNWNPIFFLLFQHKNLCEYFKSYKKWRKFELKYRLGCTLDWYSDRDAIWWVFSCLLWFELHNIVSRMRGDGSNRGCVGLMGTMSDFFFPLIFLFNGSSLFFIPLILFQGKCKIVILQKFWPFTSILIVLVTWSQIHRFK